MLSSPREAQVGSSGNMRFKSTNCSTSRVGEKDFLGNVDEQTGLREGKLIGMEEFPRCLLVFDAEHGVEIGVEKSNDVFLVGRKFAGSVGECPDDSFFVF